MGLFDRAFHQKIKQLEDNEEGMNLAKETSDKAIEVIKELSGKSLDSGAKLADDLIVFSNASGGTGASTILSNVAYTATQKGLKTIVIDLNILCPVQHTFLNISQELQKDDLVSYLLGKSTIADSIDSTNDINILFANNRTLMDQINCNEKLAIDNLNILIQRCRQFYDIILVDCPMRVDNLLENTMLYQADAIYIVWDEGAPSIINTEKLRRNMAATGIDSFTKMRVILNKRTSLHYSDYPLKKLNLELVEVLPFDTDIIDNSQRGRIFCEKGSSNSKNALEFAAKIDTLTEKIMHIGGYVDK